MDEISNKIIEIANCPVKLEKFIVEYENFIFKSASKVLKKYITKNDDEWSIALNGFYEAIKKYDKNKGSFFSFAELVIQRKLIDYYRTERKNNLEIKYDQTESSIYLNKGEDMDLERNLCWEIEAISEVIKSYGFSFSDLVKVSPKTKKTKGYCEEIIKYLLLNPILIRHIHKSKQLPIKVIEKNVKIPLKIIERYRKYIIAVVEIFWGEYPHLQDYFPNFKTFLKEVGLS